MGAPEGYVALDLVGFTDKGDYNANTVYMKNDLVHQLNDVWCSLKDNMSGIAPVQGDNWKIFVHGANTAAGMTAVDTSGLVGGEGQVVIAQELLDVISDAVLNKLVTKTMMSGVQINSADMVPTSALAYAMQQQITKLNSDSIKDNMFLAERINLGYIALTKNIDNGIYSLHFYDDSVQWLAEARFVTASCAIESDLSKLSIANIQRISSYDGILYITLANGDVYEIEMAKQ